MGLLERIASPADLRRIPEEALPDLAEELRAFLLSSVSQTGGHLASGLGALELTLALHYVFDTPRDLLVWDVGHQCYPHKVITGRRERFATLRTYGGISGFLKREESEYDAFNAGHASTSISAALGMAVARDLKGRGLPRGRDHRRRRPHRRDGDGGAQPGRLPRPQADDHPQRQRDVDLAQRRRLAGLPEPDHPRPVLPAVEGRRRAIPALDPAGRGRDGQARQAGGADGQAARRARSAVRGAGVQVRRADQRSLACRSCSRRCASTATTRTRCSSTWSPARARGTSRPRPTPCSGTARRRSRSRPARWRRRSRARRRTPRCSPRPSPSSRSPTRASSRSRPRCRRAPASTSSPRRSRSASSTSGSASSTR